MICLFPLAFAAINRFRGMDAIIPAQKIICYVLFGITMAAGAYISHIPLWWAIGLVVAAGTAFWRQQGRNQYLATVHGRIYEGQKANAIGNWIANKVVGAPEITGKITPIGKVSLHNRTWAAIGMAWIGMHAAPYIALVSLLAGNWWLMLLSTLSTIEGLIYWLCYYLPIREDKKTIPAELMTGALHGGLLWMALVTAKGL